MSRIDDFSGDNEHLVACINALLDMDDAKALVPHGLGRGSHAYRLLTAAAHRLIPSAAGDGGELVQRLLGRAQFLRDRGEIKSPELLEEAASALSTVAEEKALGPTQRCPACHIEFQIVNDVDAHLATLPSAGDA